MNIEKIGFIGLGLIGGSLAKAIRRIHPEINMIAISGHESTVNQAFQEGLIRNEHMPSITDFSDCDCIFLCTPVQQNAAYLEQLKPVISTDCILTDVGSVKGDIHTIVRDLEMEKNFIGGHPMAGSEKTGLAHSNSYLLENAYYILTPAAGFPEASAQLFSDFIASLGCIPLLLQPKAHDYATAGISHLPHVIAAALVNLVCDKDDSSETMKVIAAGGFKDITRIASSSPVMWQEICLTNKEQIVSLMDDYMDSLSKIRSHIASADAEEIMHFFEDAKDYRDSLSVSPAGKYRTVFDLYCDLIDEAGGIATIATILATNNLSIKNIGIIHNREFEEGVLKIEMYDQPSYEKAILLLERHHYTIHQR